MAYEKTNWVNGQTPINATNLNKIEQGIYDATITPKTTKTTSDSDVYACNYVNDALIEEYSTDEVMTNKVWIDGKPIYRKVIKSTSTYSANYNPSIALGLDVSTISDFIKIETIAKQSGVNVWFTGSTNNDASSRLSHYVNSNNTIVVRNSFDLDKLIIILEYTRVSE